MYGDTEELFNSLVGSKIHKVRMNEDYLVFETDNGVKAFTVYGDCCSHSYFYDFYGVQNLLDGGKVTEVGEVSLHPSDLVVNGDDGCLKVYGYKLTVESVRGLGPVTAVFSFRNSSNGYYGGYMVVANVDPESVPEITKDTLL